jgi:hypothetical protein
VIYLFYFINVSISSVKELFYFKFMKFFFVGAASGLSRPLGAGVAGPIDGSG